MKHREENFDIDDEIIEFVKSYENILKVTNPDLSVDDFIKNIVPDRLKPKIEKNRSYFEDVFFFFKVFRPKKRGEVREIMNRELGIIKARPLNERALKERGEEKFKKKLSIDEITRKIIEENKEKLKDKNYLLITSEKTGEPILLMYYTEEIGILLEKLLAEKGRKFSKRIDLIPADNIVAF